MSLETWKKEFYPIPAEKATRTWITATEHSLRKWIGRTAANLGKHEVHVSAVGNISITDDFSGDCFPFDCDSCALCQKAVYCKGCPLYKYLGMRCDDDRAPYKKLIETSDPKPMIKALRGTLRMLKREQAKRRK